jgi:DNA-binding MarR family transcriptional regulator
MFITFMSMALEIAGRPLTAAAEDQRRYIRREADDVVDRAIPLRVNTLLASPRGMGATSLLYRLEGMCADRSTYLSVRGSPEPAELLGTLAARIGADPGPAAIPAAPARDPLGALERALHERAADSAKPWLVLLDGPVSSDAEHALFGTMRDELFGLALRWVVVAPADRLAQYLVPPADVFFDHVAHLDGFTEDEQRELLRRRDVTLPPARLREVLELSDGTPRHLLALTRQALLHPDRSLLPDEPASDPTAALSRSAATVLAELQGRGPITASDPELREHLGWSEARLRRTMQELADAGLVRASQGRANGPGRPPVLYQLTTTPLVPEWE